MNARKTKIGGGYRFLNDDKALSHGGWDALAVALADKMQRIRDVLAATRTPDNVTVTRTDGADDGAILAESDVSIAALGCDPVVDEAMDWERWEAIKQALDTLPPKASECIRRYVGFGCDQEDPILIADSMRINRSTVWNNIKRGKVKLAELLIAYAD